LANESTNSTRGLAAGPKASESSASEGAVALLKRAFLKIRIAPWCRKIVRRKGVCFACEVELIAVRLTRLKLRRRFSERQRRCGGKIPRVGGSGLVGRKPGRHFLSERFRRSLCEGTDCIVGVPHRFPGVWRRTTEAAIDLGVGLAWTRVRR
jgi:hypothetical protein